MKTILRLITLKILILLIFFVFASNVRAAEDPEEKLAGALKERLANRMDEKFDRLEQALDLAPEQLVLLENMKAAFQNYFTFKAESQRQLRMIFKEEAARKSPDFKAAAERIKARHKQEETTSFDAMVDAMAAFYEGLTPEQREKAAEMKRQKMNRVRQRLENNGRTYE